MACPPNSITLYFWGRGIVSLRPAWLTLLVWVKLVRPERGGEGERGRGGERGRRGERGREKERSLARKDGEKKAPFQ